MFKRFFILNGLGIVVGIIIFSILVGTHTIGSDATATKLTVNFAIFLFLFVIVNNFDRILPCCYHSFLFSFSLRGIIFFKVILIMNTVNLLILMFVLGYGLIAYPQMLWISASVEGSLKRAQNDAACQFRQMKVQYV